jgi:hypothetical protein
VLIAKFILDDHIYYDMISISDCWKSSDLLFSPIPIENERYLIYRFIRSILKQKNENIIFFNSEDKYAKFCIENHISYETQSWFKKVCFINTSIEDAEIYLIQQSLTFQANYFPPEINGERYIPLRNPINNTDLKYKSDFTDILQILRANKVTKLYHFTDRKNLSSILKYGLYSNRKLNNSHISPTYASSEESRELDRRAELDNFVRLSFVKEHPMMFVAKSMGRIDEPVIIQIDPNVILLPNVYFSDRNGLKKGANIGQSATDLAKLHFKIFSSSYYDLSPEEKSFYQAEVIVPEHIGTHYIMNLHELQDRYL